MPIPEPKKNETKQEYIKRCMIDSTMIKEYDTNQRYAICSRNYFNLLKLYD